jgi:hypothetical protein
VRNARYHKPSAAWSAKMAKTFQTETDIKTRLFCHRASSNETRFFARHEEAYRFVMRQGELNRLWTLEAI